ncbi:MAG: iron-only hydrogenase system regulator [Solobacterium sp.]|nr:iron-only hydrogenase system regulator [Solobacterium sp.]
MDTRIAVIAIIVEDTSCVEELNALLHEYGQYIIGRMGIPYREKNISLISVAVDAPMDTISALTGRLGRISGLTVKTAYSKN